MRIGLVHSFYRDASPSGENRAVLMQAEALSRIGHEVEIFAKTSDSSLERGIPKIRAGMRVATGFGANPVSQLRAFDPDIVHVHNLFPNWSRRWFREIEAPVVLTIHNYRNLCANGLLFRDQDSCLLCPQKGSHHALVHSCYRSSRLATLPLSISTRRTNHRWVFEAAQKLVFLSDLSLRTHKRLGVDFPEKSVVIPNFLVDNLPQVSPPASRRDYWCFVGRLSPEKGILELIEHWPHGEQLKVLGVGPLLSECKQAAVGKNIVFEGMVAPSSEVKRVLSRSKGLIFPSLWHEHSPIVYAEALELGLPVIASAGNSVAEHVTKMGTGAVIESLGQIEAVMSEVESRASDIRGASLAAFSSDFSQEVWTNRIENLYRLARASYKREA